MRREVRWMICRCQMCGREFRMPIDKNLMNRLPDAYSFCSDDCRDGYVTMHVGATPKQQKYQKIQNSMGKALTKGLGMESEESGVKKMQRKYQLKKYRGLQ